MRRTTLYFMPASAMRGPKLRRRARLFTSGGDEIPLLNFEVTGTVNQVVRVTLEIDPWRARILIVEKRPRHVKR